ncbi:hypothetical protein [Streptomyces kanamyceticus]|uniref:Lipoprotein n=1 Tax=Streptomyces kanamyceticus TaxID=1967 RepID=A0A5J6GC93_STRKN|nr:hypothetical protein [Streptomyces kanamyceticus]QEU92567.1 hypothetical protein CP970_18135 [Streptomyces kanamyceticus]
MKRRTMPTIAVLAATTALVLTGCSSNSDSSDKIEGAGGEASTSPKTPKDSSTAPAKLPDFGLPADVKVEIESDTTGDKAKDRILKEQAEGLMARQRVYVDLDPNSRYLTRYYADEALAFYVSEIKKAKAEGRTITGLYRYYDRKVQSHDDDTATVTYCEDRSKAYAKDIKSGKARKTKPSPEDFIKNTATLARTEQDTWLVQSFRGETSSKECQ